VARHGMRVAAIDVGSNSIHMVVAQLEADGRFRVLDRAKEMVRLGHRTLSSGRLSGEAMDAGIRALAAFRTLAERQSVTRFKAVATSAVREAANGGDFIQRVRDEVGLRLTVIPGREEARLIYLGVRHAIDLRGEAALIVDVGGGSVELILSEDANAVALHSLKIGVARLSEKFLASDPPRAKELNDLQAYLAAQLDPILERFGPRGVRRVVATSGTMLNLIGIIAHQRGETPDGRLHHFAVTPEEVSRLRRTLCKADREQRLRIKGLDAKRVDTIVAGACLADYILEQLSAKEMIACTWALREGVLLDFIARHQKGIAESERFSDPRRRSVMRFMRHLGDSGSHGPHVAGLALQLYDQLSEVLSLPVPARDWLEFAALLHDVGHHIDHKSHQRHSYYLITNSELLGFRRDELEIIGQTARYHRKGTPKDSDEEMRLLSSSERQTVRGLSALLRVADGLDRSHYSVVRTVTAARRNGRLILQLGTGGDDAELEIWEARRRVDLLEKLLGLDVDFRVVAYTYSSMLNEPHPYPRKLIIVEGIDGSGKSTQLAVLHRWLVAEGQKVFFTEWNSSVLVRHSMKRGTKEDLLTPTTFSLLHAVDFADRTAFSRDAARGVHPGWVRAVYPA
jgi:exopolyphosphatase/guanosine-5'-triphosphate,3'-diphosphate pyrophosphatase